MQTRKARLIQAKIDKQWQIFKEIHRNLQSVAMVGVGVMGSLWVSPSASALVASQASQTQSPAQKFLSTILPQAQEVAKDKDIYLSVMVAQAALESGWGQSGLAAAPNYNLFGVKGHYEGQSVSMQTLEDAGGQNYYSIQANFRKYPSYQESLEDYVDKILNGITGAPEFYKGAWRSTTRSYQDATAYLTGRYATDTAYASKLNAIIAANGLAQYDGPSGLATQVVNKDDKSATANPSPVDPTSSDQTTSSVTSSQTETTKDQTTTNPHKETSSGQTEQATNQVGTATYTVQAGDGLYRIAAKNGVSLASLLAANQLSLSSIIHPGQKLVLPSNQSATGSNQANQTPSQAGTTTDNKPVNNPTNASGSSNPVSEINPPSAPVPSQASTTYQVQSGDYLYKIAGLYQVSLDQLLTWNNLTADSIIYPGQVLQVKAGSGTNQSQAQNQGQVASQSSEANQSSAPSRPQVSQPSQVSQASGGTTYQIQAGDTLYRIAHQHGMTLTSLLSLNGINAQTTIYPGQVLKVSGTSASPSSTYPVGQRPVTKPSPSSSTPAPVAPSTTSPVTAQSASKTYVVQAGQGLWRIAKENGLTLDQLKALNNLTSNLIYPGQVLKVG